jgi:hypothetical protein
MNNIFILKMTLLKHTCIIDTVPGSTQDRRTEEFERSARTRHCHRHRRRTCSSKEEILPSLLSPGP